MYVIGSSDNRCSSRHAFGGSAGGRRGAPPPSCPGAAPAPAHVRQPPTRVKLPRLCRGVSTVEEREQFELRSTPAVAFPAKLFICVEERWEGTHSRTLALRDSK